MRYVRRRYHPMGQPVDLTTNSVWITTAASRLWRKYPKLSSEKPVQLQIHVAESDALFEPIPAMPCHFEHLMAIVQGPENFAIADMAAGRGVICVTRDVARNGPAFIYHFLEPITYVLLGSRHLTILHAASVALAGKAALLCGPSGAGKTCLAYACAKRGWQFVSGDATHLVRDAAEPAVIGRPFSIRFRDSAKSIFPELRRHHSMLRPNGKRDLELSTTELCLETAVQSKLAMAVLLNRQPGPHASPCRMEAISRTEVRDLIVTESICFGDAKCRQEQQSSIERILNLPLFWLCYADPFAAEALLRCALRENE
jgi:hypothetical protein